MEICEETSFQLEALVLLENTSGAVEFRGHQGRAQNQVGPARWKHKRAMHLLNRAMLHADPTDGGRICGHHTHMKFRLGKDLGKAIGYTKSTMPDLCCSYSSGYSMARHLKVTAQDNCFSSRGPCFPSEFRFQDSIKLRRFIIGSRKGCNSSHYVADALPEFERRIPIYAASKHSDYALHFL